MEVKALLKRLGVEPVVIELDELGEEFFPAYQFVFCTVIVYLPLNLTFLISNFCTRAAYHPARVICSPKFMFLCEILKHCQILLR